MKRDLVSDFDLYSPHTRSVDSHALNDLINLTLGVGSMEVGYAMGMASLAPTPFSPILATGAALLITGGGLSTISSGLNLVSHLSTTENASAFHKATTYTTLGGMTGAAGAGAWQFWGLDIPAKLAAQNIDLLSGFSLGSPQSSFSLFEAAVSTGSNIWGLWNTPDQIQYNLGLPQSSTDGVPNGYLLDKSLMDEFPGWGGDDPSGLGSDGGWINSPMDWPYGGGGGGGISDSLDYNTMLA